MSEKLRECPFCSGVAEMQEYNDGNSGNYARVKAGEAMREAIERHAKAGQELAEYASYAEIVGGISVNQPAIRKWCDEVLKANRDVQDAKDALAALPTPTTPTEIK